MPRCVRRGGRMGSSSSSPTRQQVSEAFTNGPGSGDVAELRIAEFAVRAEYRTEDMTNGVRARGRGVLSGIPMNGRCEVSAPAGRGSSKKQTKQSKYEWGDPDKWHLHAIGRAAEPLEFLPGDLVDFTVVWLDGKAYFHELFVVERGTSGLDMAALGAPQDFGFSYARFHRHCGPEAVSEQRCVNWFDSSIVFSSFFEKKAVRWQATVLGVNAKKRVIRGSRASWLSVFSHTSNPHRSQSLDRFSCKI